MNPKPLLSALTLSFLIIPTSTPHAQTIQTYFSPNGGTTAAIVQQIDDAQCSIDVAAYYLTSRPLAAALIAAQARSVKIRCVLDRSQEASNRPTPRSLHDANIPIRTDRNETLHHNKYAIIDADTLITGSFNWSASAENRNAENLLIIKHQPTASQYAADFTRHWEHADPFHSNAPPPPDDSTQRTSPLGPPIHQTALAYDAGISLDTVLDAKAQRPALCRIKTRIRNRPHLLIRTLPRYREHPRARAIRNEARSKPRTQIHRNSPTIHLRPRSHFH